MVKAEIANKKKREKEILENYRWFSRFSAVEKLRIAKRARIFLKVLKDAR